MGLITKSVFKIAKMDCPSEEQMIRLKLEGIATIKQLQFDISNRILTVFHIGEVGTFDYKIHELKLEAKLIESFQDKYELESKEHHALQRKALWSVLLINFTFFLIEMTYGWLSHSMGLVADSLDMLADSIVYGLSLLAIGTALSRKKQVAKASGYFQMLLATIGLIEVLRRFLGIEEVPVFQTMIVVSALALIANTISLWLIQKTKSEEAHMQASAIFTSNDIIINAGVILAGVLVYFTSSKYPDLIIGFIIFLIVIKGAVRILKLAK